MVDDPVQTFELASSHYPAYFGITGIIGRKRKDKIRVQFWIVVTKQVTKILIIGFAHHTMGAQQTRLLVDKRIIGADHAAFNGTHVMGVIEREIGNPADTTEALTVMRRTM